MSAPPGQTGDAQLVAGVLAGDRDAFAAVYDRYGDRLHDFCYALLRHREDAADAVTDTFVIVAERIGQLRDPDRLRPWLYAIARSEGLRRLRARKRVTLDSETELAGMADVGAGPESAAEQAALRDLVWNAAAGLADRDRALLDLHLRQGLDGAELGEAMGVTAQHAYVMLTRLRDQVERSLGALLIARLGRADCTALDGLLAGWDGGFSPLIRKRVARHVDSCEVCSDRRRRVVSPWALLAAVPLVPAPLALRDRVLTDTRLVAYSGPPPGASGPTRSRARLPIAAPALVIAMLVIAALVIAALVIGGVGIGASGLWPPGPAAEPAPIAAAPSQLTSAPATGLSALPPPGSAGAPPGSLSVSTRTVDLGPTGTTATVRLTNTGDQPVTFAVRPQDPWLTVDPSGGRLEGNAATDLRVTADRARLPEGPAGGRIIVTGAGDAIPVVITLTEERVPVVGSPRPGGTSCEFPVTVAASDDTGLESVTLTWVRPDGASFTTSMTATGGRWTGRAGPFPVGGETNLQVTAVDTRGNSATGPAARLRVDPCPG